MDLQHKIYIYLSLAILIFVIIFAIAFGMGNNQYALKINNENVSLAEFNGYLKIVKDQMETSAKQQDNSLKSEDIWKMKLEGTNVADYAKQSAETWVKDIKVTNQKAAELGVKLTDDDKDLITQNSDMLKKYGFPEKYIDKASRELTVYSKVIDTVTKDVKAPDWDLSKYYKVRHILFFTIDQNTGAEFPADKIKEVQAKAQEVLKKVNAGEDFSSLAKQYSEDPGSKDKNGEFDFFMGQAVTEFQNAVKKLNPGETTSTLIKTEYGYHIIKLDSVSEPTKEEVNAAKQTLEQTLQQSKNAEFESKVNVWIQSSKIITNDNVINSIDVSSLK